jgi:hypothetical protein
VDPMTFAPILSMGEHAELGVAADALERVGRTWACRVLPSRATNPSITAAAASPSRIRRRRTASGAGSSGQAEEPESSG